MCPAYVVPLTSDGKSGFPCPSTYQMVSSGIVLFGRTLGQLSTLYVDWVGHWSGSVCGSGVPGSPTMVGMRPPMALMNPVQ